MRLNHIQDIICTQPLHWHGTSFYADKKVYVNGMNYCEFIPYLIGEVYDKFMFHNTSYGIKRDLLTKSTLIKHKKEW